VEREAFLDELNHFVELLHLLEVGGVRLCGWQRSSVREYAHGKTVYGGQGDIASITQSD